MSKGKLEKFAEVAGFPNVLQPPFGEVFGRDHPLKGRWNTEFFKNEKPITLELGCGKGEYTVGLARLYPERNFLGVDIKGARIWKGAKTALESGLRNVGFLRTRIDFIESFFSANEIHEIWITFPDPQLKKDLKKLTSSRFLNRYRGFLQVTGSINLKTDSEELYLYTLDLIRHNQLELLFHTNDLYASDYHDTILSIPTFYEKMWLEEGKPIRYIKFRLNSEYQISELPDEK